MALQRTYSDRFERIWSVYPKWPSGRSKKELAFKSFQAADRILKFDDSDIEAIRENIEERLRFCETWQRGNKFGPVGMQVYLNQHLWNEPYPRFKSPVRQSSAPPVDLWLRMGYASEADYYAGKRMNH
jgi:hypothetical protein